MTVCILSFAGCEDVIHVGLDTETPRLVIDASIDWVKGTSGSEQKIKLSTSTGYYNSEFPTVSGATVLITNTANTVFNFTETPGTGEYICHDFQPVIGETYNLTITLNGETYTATEKMIDVPSMESTINQNNSGGFGGDEIEITSFFQDDGSRENYYLYCYKSVRVAFPEYEVEGDENDQGNLITMYYSDEDLKPGDLVNIKLYGISKRYHDYFNKILLSSGESNGPFPSTPAAVRGNIINQTHFNNYVFGYFRLCEVDIKDYTVQ